MEIIFAVFLITSKLDPVARWWIKPNAKFAPPPPLISVMVYASSGFKPYKGLRMRKVNDKYIYTGKIPLEALKKISKNPYVHYIHISRKLTPLLDYNSSALGFTYIRTEMGYTGRGVVVGVVDTGIDISHPDFRNDDGSVRIAFVWDQTQNGEPPAGFDYGTECDAYEINTGECEIDFEDTYGHGTHISGMLFSDDLQYTGLVTESIPVFVKTTYEENEVIDAVSYIFSIAERYSLPAVVNLSLGGHVGPHDGTSMFEETLSSLTGAGRIIVASAGNDGNKNIHVGYPVQTTEGVFLKIPSLFGLGGTAMMEFWYGKEYSYEFRVVAVDDTFTVLDGTSWVTPATYEVKTLVGGGKKLGECYVDATVTSYPFSGKKYVYVEIKSYDTSLMWGILQRPLNGEKGGGELHGWLLSPLSVISSAGEYRELCEGGKCFTVHTHPGDSYYTVMIPATARDVISVGAYVGRTSWLSLSGMYSEEITKGTLASFSSKGPSLNPYYTGIKPLITAPGQWVISTLSSFLKGLPSYYIADDENHYALDGTSISTPFVTALSAVLLQKNFTLTSHEIAEAICSNAKVDNFTGEVPSPEWGCGKLQVRDTLNAVSDFQLDYPLPSVVKINKLEGGLFIGTDTLTKVIVYSGKSVATDMSFATRHFVKGDFASTLKIVLIDPLGRRTLAEEEVIEGGCGCAEAGRGGIVEFVLLFLTVGYLTVKIMQIYASNRD